MRRFDKYGWLIDELGREALADMTSPVRCTHCWRIYDLGTVTITGRYLDCTMWTSPCCRRKVDDRGAGWKSRPDIEPIR